MMQDSSAGATFLSSGELFGIHMATIVLGVALLKEVLLGMVLLVLVMMAIAVAVACAGPQDGGDGGGSDVGCSRHGGGGNYSAEPWLQT